MNSKEREALKLVLGVLRPPYCDAPLEDVIRAVEEALMPQSDGAQPEQRNANEHLEPVAHCEAGPEHCPVCRAETRSLAQPEQEPFRFTDKENWLSGNGRMWSEMHREDGDFPIYTTPPQRTWVGLTDDERKNILIECSSTGDWAWELNAAQAIEAKLKEKNFS
jgi:hypothetical protein